MLRALITESESSGRESETLDTRTCCFVFVAADHACAMLCRRTLKPPILTPASKATREFFVNLRKLTIATEHEYEEIPLILAEEIGFQSWGMAFACMVGHNDQFEYPAKSYI